MIRKISYILFFVAIIAHWATAQPNGLTIYEFPKQIPIEYQLHIETELAKTTDKSNSLLSDKEFQQFIKSIVINKKHQINEGELYLNWEVVESYLSGILNRLLPDTLKQDEIKIYIRRDALPNAYSAYDASIYINLGLLADIESEAALAFVIAHELAHYIGDHQLRNYKLFKQNEKNESGKFKKLVHKNQSLELEADRIAAQMIDQAGFNVNCIYSVFDLIYTNENTFKTERVENIKQYTKPLDSTLIQNKNSDRFFEIKQMAKYEKANLLLSNFEYNKCLYQSLNYYLMDTTLRYFPFYIVEAARRYILLHPDEMYDSIIEEGKDTPFRQYIALEKFTYKNIIEYFLSPDFLKQLPDLLFSKATYYYQLMDTLRAKQAFRQYTDSFAFQHNKLANYLINRSDFDLNSKKSITLINNIKSYQLKEKEDPIYDLNNSEELNQKYLTKLKSLLVKEFPKQHFNFRRDLLEEDFKLTQQLQSAGIAILLAQNIHDKYTLPVNELVFLLQPNLFNVLNQSQLNDLTFIKINAFEKNKKQTFGEMVNPINWLGNFFRSFIKGANNHYYNVEQIKLNQNHNVVFYQLDTINFKLNLPHLLHSIYASLKSEENRSENFIEN